MKINGIKAVKTGFILLTLLACTNENSDVDTQQEDAVQQEIATEFQQTPEKVEMVNTLRDIAANGIPENNMYWNDKRANQLAGIIQSRDPNLFDPTWFDYCQELLWAGRSQD